MIEVTISCHSISVQKMSENTLPTVVEMSEVELDDHIDSKVSEERVEGMMRKMESTQEKIVHLTKVKDRWQQADNIVNAVGITLTFIPTLLTAIVNIIPDNHISSADLKITSVVLTSLAGAFSLAKEGTIIGFTSKNKMKFMNQIRELEMKYHKCFILFEKARVDKKITNDELIRFYSIFSPPPIMET